MGDRVVEFGGGEGVVSLTESLGLLLLEIVVERVRALERVFDAREREGQGCGLNIG